MSTNRTAIREETKLHFTVGLTIQVLLMQIVDREQELMSTARLQSLGRGAGLGRAGLDRELRIVPSKPGLDLQFSCMCHHAPAGREQGMHN